MPSYFDLQNAPVLTTPSTLTVPKITSIGYPGDDTAADPAGGQTITLTGSGFVAGASVIINGNAVGVVSVVSSTTITFTSPAQSAGSYVLYVVNTDGSTAVAVPGIQYSGTPTWTTAAGSLGSYTETVAIANTVTATGDAPITYSVFSGSLPTGATLNSANGYISGTSPAAASPTTYTFTIRATDAQQQDTNRSFSLTINPDAVTWSSPANGTTYASVANTALANVPLSASAASGQNITYTANALPTGLSISGSNITGTPTVVANSSTLLTATANTTNATATRTINWVISVASDTYFPYVTTLLSASTPASTFVTDASTNAFNVTVFGDTRPSNFGPYTPGYYSNYLDGTGDYLSIADNVNLEFGSSTITAECWFYMTGSAGYLMDKNNSGIGSAPGFGLYVSTSQIIWYYDAENNGYVISPISTTVTQNAWHHIALVRSVAGSTTNSVFLDGVRVGTSSTSNAFPDNSQPFRIGATFLSGSPYSPFTGFISNVRLVKGTAVYDPAQTTITVPTTPLTAVANTQLLTCQSNRFIDNSTNNFTVTRNGDTLISGFDPFVPSSSYAGYGSGFFDGTGDYLSVAPASAIDLASGDFTIEAWVLPTTQTNSVDSVLGYGIYTIMLYRNSTTWTWEVGNGSSANYFTITGTCTPNTWQHVALTRSGNTFTFWLNGVSAGTGSTANAVATASKTLNIGYNGNTTQFFTGYISNFRIVKGTAVYTGAFTPPTSPLTAIANTSLLTLQNNRPTNNSMFLDSSTNNFNITRNGNTTQGSFSPYGGGWSYYFDGTGDTISIADNAALEPTNQNFCIEAWMYPTVTGDFYWYGKGDASSAAGSTFSVTRNLTSFYIGGAGYSLSTSGAFVTNQWNHYVLSRSSGRASVFVNGNRVSTDATLGSGSLNNTSNALIIGGYTGSPLTGYLSNFRYVVGSAVYDPTQTTITVPTAPLTPIANTQLLTCADNRFIDDSPNNFAITRNGDTSIQRFNPWNPVLTTPTSYSGYFDGTGDTISAASNANLIFGTGDFTVECWINSGSQPGSFNTIIGGDTNGAMLLTITGSGTSTGVAVNPYGAANVYNQSYTFTQGTWFHIAVTRSGTSLRVFVNGTQLGSTVTDSTNFSAATRIIGGAGTSLQNFAGYVSNARIVKGTAVYTSNFTPSTTPLTAIANTSLLTLQSPTFVDNSTNNFTITATGDTAPRQFNPFGWNSTTGSGAAYTPALYGGSAYFDGTGDYISLASNAAFGFGTGDFTIEYFVYPTVLSGTKQVLDMRAGSSNVSLIDFYLEGTMLRFVTNLAVRIDSNTALVPNAWTHCALVRSSGVTRMYVNGVQQTTTYTDSTNYATTSVVLGASNDGSFNNNYVGYLSDVRITKGQARYTSNFQPPIAPLTALPNTVLLNNMTGAGIYDSTGITTFETVGDARINTSVKKYGNTSMYFDGTGDYLITPTLIEPYLFKSTVNWTIEFWFNTTSSSAAMGMVDTYNVNAGPYSGLIIQMLSGQISIWDGADNRATTGTYNDGSWYHFAWTNSGGTSRVFINGINVSLGGVTSWATSSNIYRPNAPLQIARKFSGETFNGYLDDFRITMGVARYTANFTPPTTPFITN